MIWKTELYAEGLRTELKGKPSHLELTSNTGFKWFVFI
jgi:hypothetical protein